MFTLCVSVEFDAAHRLHQYNGKCSNIHGHRYVLEVSVAGQIAVNGIAADFTHLKECVGSFVEDKFDHKLILCSDDPLNDDLADSGVDIVTLAANPTAEIMASFLFYELKELVDKNFSYVSLKKVRLFETPTSYAEVD